MREIRDEIKKETKDMSFDELRKYIDKKLMTKTIYLAIIFFLSPVSKNIAQTAYVTNSNGNTISVIDVATNVVHELF
jgi:hypothetical protein